MFPYNAEVKRYSLVNKSSLANFSLSVKNIDAHSDKPNIKISVIYLSISSLSRLHIIYYEDRML